MTAEKTSTQSVPGPEVGSDRVPLFEFVGDGDGEVLGRGVALSVFVGDEFALGGPVLASLIS